MLKTLQACASSKVCCMLCGLTSKLVTLTSNLHFSAYKRQSDFRLDKCESKAKAKMQC